MSVWVKLGAACLSALRGDVRGTAKPPDSPDTPKRRNERTAQVDKARCKAKYPTRGAKGPAPNMHEH